MKIIIIGGVAGGASAAARLRRLDEQAEIIMLERGSYISYANCGLPYYIGGEITEEEALTLQTPQSFHRRFRIDVRTMQEAIGIDRNAKQVSVKRLDDGSIYTETYDKLILSPGAKAFLPPVSGMDDPRVFTLRTIPDTLKIKQYIQKNKPKSAAIIGGGYIGVEMAENLFKAGLQVSIVEMAPHLIGPLDQDMAADVHHYITGKGIQLFLGRKLTKLQPNKKALQLLLDKGSLQADMVLVSTGVTPDSSLAKEAALKLNPRGAIIVDPQMCTSDPDIYAVGDAVEVMNFVTEKADYIPLAGPANKQGRIAADNICGINSQYSGTQGSAILKVFDMSIATTGLNEVAAQAAGLEYDKMFTYSPSHATYYPGARNMSIKTIFQPGTGKIMGAQIVGFEGVDKRIDVLATAIRAGMHAAELTQLELAYAPPFSSAKDPVNMAGFAIENVVSGKVKQHHWHDIASLSQDKDVLLLDTRTPAEYARGHIQGTIHIPLDELRERLDELDKNKKIYVNCQSGLRSYIACRILSQNGFDCSNLSGGYRLYQSVTSDTVFDERLCHSCGVLL